ncbi:MAG TPA: hypothetical protein VGJ97_04705 [Anaerolineaceae bacterium]
MADYHDLDTPSSAETPPPNGSGNRTFLALIGVLGVIFLVALALMATYLLVIRPRQSAQQPSPEAKLMAEGTATALIATRDSLLLAITQTPGAIASVTVLASTSETPGAIASATVLASTGETPGAPTTAETSAPQPSPTVGGYPVPVGETALPTQPGVAVIPTLANPAVTSTEAALGSSPTLAAPAVNPTQAGYPATGQATATRAAVVPTATATSVMIDARTATVAALLTQAATNAPPGTSQPKATNTQVFAQGTPDTSILAGTATPSPLPTATALPKTGFAEEAGIPGLMGVAVALLIVIVVARGLRARTS